MSTLRIKDLVVAVKDKEILKGLSIEFDTNKTVALLGPNGIMTKSCLLRF